jgi:BirA family transcriptional regulator, biotin operon repressor / biotin---[acetyl-CoA-carboxylase] ligase
MSLDEELVKPLLRTAWLGRAWRALERCVSTNDEAAAWARAGAPAGAVVVADAQERGRGRLGRRWHSPPGESLYFSVVLRPAFEAARVPPVTLAAGVAVAEALADFEVAPALKWPNDVLVGGRKVAGILAEMTSVRSRVEHLVIGIGVNLDVVEFPVELRASATSLKLARGGRSVERAVFAAALCNRLEVWYQRFLDGGAPVVAAGWRRWAGFLGQRVRVSAGREHLAGVAEDLDDEGALLLRLDDGRLERVIAGELEPPAP